MSLPGRSIPPWQMQSIRMLGNGELVQQKNFFPSIKEDSGYRILLGREQIAPFEQILH